MRRAALTARGLRILQIGILAVLCLSLVLAGVLGNRCGVDRSEDADADADRGEARFHATALQTAFTDAGFLADGNLYAYTLTPSDGTRVSVAVQLSTVQAANDTVELRFLAVNSTADGGGSELMQILQERAAAMRVWQQTLLDALTAAMTEANAGAAPEHADRLAADVLASVDSGKAFRLEAGRFAVEGGYTDPDSPNLYVLLVRAVD